MFDAVCKLRVFVAGKNMLSVEYVELLSSMHQCVRISTFSSILSYGLFASLSTFLKQEMGRYLQPILKHVLETLRSTEGFVVR
jgi:hypothetical protein